MTINQLKNKFSTLFKNNRHKYWAIALAISLVILIFDTALTSIKTTLATANEPVQKTTILVNAPENMHGVFIDTVKETKLDEKYTVEFTENKAEANFIINEGLNATGELIAYSPIIAIFNKDDTFLNSLIEKEIFIKSTLYSDDDEIYDFNFSKIMTEIVNNSSSEFKICYPKQNSCYWEEFYNFLLITANDGFYPKTEKDKENASNIVEKFLNSKYTVEIDLSSLEKINSFSKDSIYFMPLVTLDELYDHYNLSGDCKIMYTPDVVFHNYYAEYDNLGKILYDGLSMKEDTWFIPSKNQGYHNLRYYSYDTKYGKCKNLTDYIYGERDNFNIVEIPENTSNN